MVPDGEDTVDNGEDMEDMEPVCTEPDGEVMEDMVPH
jgi:hypothetical protein